jgi:hypothetical protein
MSDEPEPRGTMEKVGEESVEIYRLTLELDDLDEATKEKAEADPQGFLRRFLEARGHEVNAVVMSTPFDGHWPRDWIHIPSGPQRSEWHQILM